MSPELVNVRGTSPHLMLRDQTKHQGINIFTKDFGSVSVDGYNVFGV